MSILLFEFVCLDSLGVLGEICIPPSRDDEERPLQTCPGKWYQKLKYNGSNSLKFKNSPK